MSETGLPILYSFRRCPYAIRARMALRYAGIRVELREVVLKEKPEALFDASEKATVPVLILNNGITIDESIEIMHWAISCNDPDGWFNVLNGEQSALIECNDTQFKPLLDGYKYPGKHHSLSSDDCQSKAIEIMIKPIEARLRTQAFLFGSDMQLADVAIFPFIRQFDAVDKYALDKKTYPALRIWLEGMNESELYRSVMRKYEQWQEYDEPVFF